MDIEKIESALNDANINPENLIKAIIQFIEAFHVMGLDADAVELLATCGITLELEA